MAKALSDLYGDTEKSKWKQLRVRVPRRLYDRFTEILPMHGAVTWFVLESMKHFVMECGDFPRDAAARTARSLARDLTKGRVQTILEEVGEDGNS